MGVNGPIGKEGKDIQKKSETPLDKIRRKKFLKNQTRSFINGQARVLKKARGRR